MKKLVLALLVLAAMSSFAFAGDELDEQNSQMDLLSASDSDC